jgi:PAS domain S-box-containing protein
MTPSKTHNSSTATPSDDEDLRLQAIESLGLMYGESDEKFDHLTELAKNIFETPISLITLLDDTHQRYLSESGCDLEKTNREDSFCQFALNNDPGEVLAVPDATNDKRFKDLPIVSGKPHVRSYLGAPIVSLHGHVLGTICVLDTEPRTFTSDEKRNLRDLAKEISIRFQQREQQLDIQENTLIEQRKLKYLDELITQIPALILVADNNMNVLELRGSGLDELPIESIDPETDERVPLHKLYEPEQEHQLDRHRNAISQALDGQTLDEEIAFGSRHYQSIVTPFRDGRDDITGAIAVAVDITRQKEKERELKETKDMLETMAETIDECFWITDPSKNEIIYISSSFEDIWGYSLEELYNQPDKWLESIHNEDRKRVESEIPESQLKGDYDIEYRIVRPDGETRWIHDKAFPVEDENGTVKRIVGVAKDITERVNRERKIKQQEKLASIGEMAASVMHEINNPNGFIQGNLEFLTKIYSKIEENIDDFPLDEDTKNYLKKDFPEALESSYGGTKRIERIVNNVKRFARESQESPDSTYSVQNACYKVHELIKNFHSQQDQPITLTNHVCELETKRNVKLSEDDFETIVTNLINNALDATKSVEKSEITIGLNEDGDTFTLTVEDNGVGIPEETLSKITDPFFSTKSKAEGTGLGMSIIATMVDRANGDLSIDTEVDEGTTVTIELPTQASG